MTTEEFEYVAEQIKPFCRFVYFHVKGEPLLHPRLENFLDIAKKHELLVNLTTNATLLKEREALLLLHPAVRQVNLSLHSFGGEKSQKDKLSYIDTAIDFAKKASQKGIFVVMRLWNLTAENNGAAENHEVMKKIETAFAYDKPLFDSMGGRQSVKLAPYAFIGWEKEFVWPSLSNEFISDDGFCYGMRYQAAILADGTVVPCCLDANGEAALGNIFETPFQEIIESKRARAIRHGFENRHAVDPLCKRCQFRTKFDDIQNL